MTLDTWASQRIHVDLMPLGDAPCHRKVQTLSGHCLPSVAMQWFHTSCLVTEHKPKEANGVYVWIKYP